MNRPRPSPNGSGPANNRNPVVSRASSRRDALWHMVAFLAVFVLLQSLYGQARGTWFERVLIDHLTVETAARLIETFTPEVGVVAVGSRLKAPGGGVNVLNGCEGTEAMFLLGAAMLVAPLALRWRLLGLLGSGLFIFAVNQIRVLLLFYTFRADRPLFDVLHGFVAPLVLVVLAMMFFVAWTGFFQRRPAMT